MQLNLDHTNEKEQGKNNHHDRSHPGDGIEDGAVGMVHHYLFIIDDKKHEDEDEGKDHSIDDL